MSRKKKAKIEWPDFLYVNLHAASGVGVATIAWRLAQEEVENYGLATVAHFAIAWCSPTDRFSRSGPKGGRIKATKKLDSGSPAVVFKTDVLPEKPTTNDMINSILAACNHILDDCRKNGEEFQKTHHIPRWALGCLGFDAVHVRGSKR